MRDLGLAVELMLPAIARLNRRRTTFLGDCMGAIMAYEAIRAAAAQDLSLPERLVVSCCRAPHLPLGRTDLHLLADDALIAEIAAMSYAPAWLLEDTGTFKQFLPILRCDYELAETYRHEDGPPIGVPITAFAATGDKVALRDDIAEWRRHTSKEFDLIEIGGGHDAATARAEEFLRLMLERSTSPALP